jgi:hypothetical protein
MYKFAIVGKANSGKNTLANLIFEHIKHYETNLNKITNFEEKIKLVAFADPIKKMIEIMFPSIDKNYLYGSSSLRNSVIPNAFKDNQPLTVRQLLIDLGTGLGRSYNENVWIDNLLFKLDTAEKENALAFAVPDVRFVNECKILKEKKFFIIKLIRDSELKINHISETNQNSIPDEEFDYIVYNNKTLDKLADQASQIFNCLKDNKNQ